MSCSVTTTTVAAPSSSLPVPGGVRKRTSSFSTPKPGPHKVPRTTSSGTRPLRRTISFAVLPNTPVDDTLYTGDGFEPPPFAPTGAPAPQRTHKPDCSSLVPYNRTLRFYKEQRERRKGLSRTYSEYNLVFGSAPIPTTPDTSSMPTSRLPVPKPAQTVKIESRTTSPLSPHPSNNLARRRLPRGKREPDLYRVAIMTRMRCSPEGQKILLMGPRLAVSILSATRELERMVGERDGDGDVVMKTEPPGEDWEMVDCGL